MGLYIAGFVLGSEVFGTAGQDKKASGNEEYIGSEGCRKCHPAEYDSWKLTYHSKMVRKRVEGILKDVVKKWTTDGINPDPTEANVTGKKAGVPDVVYVIGSNWKQRFLVKDESTGGYQFLNKQYNRYSGKWENYGNKNDWDTMCATCHTTGYRLLEYDPANPKAQKATWVELNNGCENCHGPGESAGRPPRSESRRHLQAVGRLDEVVSGARDHARNPARRQDRRRVQGRPERDVPTGQRFQGPRRVRGRQAP